MISSAQKNNHFLILPFRRAAAIILSEIFYSNKNVLQRTGTACFLHHFFFCPTRNRRRFKSPLKSHLFATFSAFNCPKSEFGLTWNQLNTRKVYGILATRAHPQVMNSLILACPGFAISALEKEDNDTCPLSFVHLSEAIFQM